MLIQQLTGSHLSSRDRFYRTLYESLLDPRLLSSSKHALYLNVLFKALRSDLSIKRVKAFAKRLLQVVAMHQAPFAIGALYLLRELEGVFPSLKTLVDEPEANESDETENFQDVRDETDGEANSPNQVNGKAVGAGVKMDEPPSRYNPRKRDPQFSNADRSCLWELVSPFPMSRRGRSR
jgi:ribosome biogenesis protein MAK21